MKKNTTKIRFLPVVATCAASLVLLRLVGLTVGVGSATAQVNVSSSNSATSLVEDNSTPIETPIIPASKSDTEKELLALLKRRKDELDARETQLDTREKLLRAAEQSIDVKLAMIKEERSFLADEQRQRTDRQLAEFEELSNVYSRMKAKDAAQIFETLDDDILVPVAAGMRVQAISGVLAEMSPDKARALTKSLAEFSKGEVQ